MAYKIEGETCPVCKAYLFNDDDVVFCPICGAPHHRDCYAALGHCALEELHGTENQYSPKKDEPEAPENGHEKKSAKRCGRCGRDADQSALFCPYCGNDLSSQDGAPNYPQFSGIYVDPYGGVPRDGSVTVDGQNLDDVKKFVFSNTQRYIPLFARLTEKGKTAWNWAAFIFPHCWLFFRKQYTAGIIASVLTVISSLCAIPLSAELAAATSSLVNPSNQQLMQQIAEFLPSASLFAIIMLAIGWVLKLGTMIVFGLYGDWFYRQHTVASIKEINEKTDSEERDTAYMKRGGINIWSFMLCYLVCTYLPQIIATLL